MNYARFLLTVGFTILAVLFLNTPMGSIPPLGKFFSPFSGFWANAAPANHPSVQTLRLPGLQASVTVVWDKREVPHIFAQNDADLYFSHGYIMARDRLWQMEFQTYIAAGRLAEIFGEKLLSFDIKQRRLGILEAAKKSCDASTTDPATWEIATAYSAGVNAYIQSLKRTTYPLEYKIFDYAPEPWTPLKSALLLKYMAWRLAGAEPELAMTDILKKFGPQVVAALFPIHTADVDPVIPKGTPWPAPVLQPIAPSQTFFPHYSDQAVPPPIERVPSLKEESKGSNNWAVAGTKTASGYPLLANDPHLNLTLPSNWYEIQLASPSVNVYGVTIPGAPGVLIGFNQHIAWGVTNAEDDVSDWYEIRFKDEKREEYWHDGVWKKIRVVEEKIVVRGGTTLCERVPYTHHGPLVVMPGDKRLDEPLPIQCAFRWAGHDAGQELAAFHRLNRAKNYEDYVAALANYGCPAQNFVFACADGDIAIWHNGKLPARWHGQGMFVSDGTDPLYDWQGWIPHQHNPHVKNPARGFVSSANQHATDGSYPYFLWGFHETYRNVRINECLREMQQITPTDFDRLQNDTKNLHAASVLPDLLKLTENKAVDPLQKAMLQTLQTWNYCHDADQIAPTIFAAWWRALYHAIWEDEFGPQPHALYPSRHRTVELICKEPQARWFDDLRTPGKETLGDLVHRSLAQAAQNLVKKYGQIGPNWMWGNYQGTDIAHLARIPGLGRLHLFVGGAGGCVKACTKTTGPSWRMIVALGKPVQAWGIYPGGQSGNPGSPHYDEFVDSWARGELYKLVYLQSPREHHDDVVGFWQLERK